MKAIKLDSTLSLGYCRDYELFGKEFPRHLQIAYGRYLAKLMFNPKAEQPKFTLWLRDLPLNMFDLEERGYGFVVKAYEAESGRKHGLIA